MLNNSPLFRSFTHPIADHVAAIRHVLSGGTVTAKDKETDVFRWGRGSLGLRGSNHPTNGFPTFGLITADEVDGQYSSERGRVQVGSKSGTLGLTYAPFEPSGKSEIVKNLKLNIKADRLDDRRSLLHSLDALKREVDANGSVTGLDKFEQQAFDLILGGAGKALDLKDEIRVGSSVTTPATSRSVTRSSANRRSAIKCSSPRRCAKPALVRHRA